jgi:hypothetical protein
MAVRPIDRQKMRRDLHAKAAVPALYFAASEAEPLPVMVRGPHDRALTLGDEVGDGGAAMREVSTRIIFLVDEVPLPTRGGFATLAAGEAYVLGEALPVDGITITVAAARLSATQLAPLDLAVPDITTHPDCF